VVEWRIMLARYRLFGLAAPLALLGILAASCAVFWSLVAQWTTRRRWLAMSDWADVNRLALRKGDEASVPDALKSLGWEPAKALLSLSDSDTTIVQVEAVALPGKATKGQRTRWNLLIRNAGSSWPIVGLRPAVHINSILDYLPPGSVQAMAPGERFVLYASQTTAGRALARSSARALLPPDVGMMLAGESLVLDFSTRPFDPLELQRMDALAKQLVAHLQASAARGRT